MRPRGRRARSAALVRVREQDAPPGAGASHRGSPRRQCEQRADEERDVVAARERDRLAPTVGEQRVRPRAARLARTARPSAPPIMNDVLTTPDARPLARLDVAHCGEQHRVERHAGTEPEQDHAGSTSTTNVPSTGARAKSSRPTRGEAEADRERHPDAEAHDEPRREPDRQDAHDDVAGQEGETDLERAVPEDELQVERGEEEPREHRAGPEHADDVRDRDVPRAGRAGAA